MWDGKRGYNIRADAEQGQIRTGVTQAVCHPVPKAVLSSVPHSQHYLVTRHISDACQISATALCWFTVCVSLVDGISPLTAVPLCTENYTDIEQSEVTPTLAWLSKPQLHWGLFSAQQSSCFFRALQQAEVAPLCLLTGTVSASRDKGTGSIEPHEPSQVPSLEHHCEGGQKHESFTKPK